MERKLERKKIVRGVIGLYFVHVTTDFSEGLHHIKVFDRNPANDQPEEVRVLGLRFRLDPPKREPLIEMTYPLHDNIAKRIEELVYMHELPMIRLQELDQWDGVVRPPKREPEPEPVAVTGQEDAGNPTAGQGHNIVRIRDWRRPGIVTCYDPVTRRTWTEDAEPDEDLEDIEDLEESG